MGVTVAEMKGDTYQLGLLCANFWGTWKGAHLPGTSEDGWRRALEKKCLSLWKLYEGNLEGGFLYWGPRRICYIRLWKWSISLWKLYEGNLEEGFLYWGPQRICYIRLWKWSISLWKLYEGNLEEGFLYWGPQRICYVRFWKWASVSTGAPFWRTWGGRSFPRAFERRVRFNFHQKDFYWGIRELCTSRLWKRATLSVGDPTGEPGGGLFTGTFERQTKVGS